MESREKAWYMLLFQFEGVAEELLMRDDWALFREWTRGDGDTEQAIERLSRPGALTAALNWYRASMHPRFELGAARPRPGRARAGARDVEHGRRYLVERGMLRSEAWVEAEWRYERVEDASHWMQLDQPERVNELLLEFLG